MAKTKTPTPPPAKRPVASAADNVIVKKPVSDVYTALAAGALVAMLLALLCVWVRGNTVFGDIFSF